MVNFKTLAIVALGLVASGCHTSYELSSRHFQVTSDFTDEQYAVMRVEVDHLCEVNDGRCIYISREPWHNKVVLADMPKDSGMLSIREDGLRTIRLDRYVVEMGYLGQVFRHEIGHAAGCIGPNNGHIDGEDNLMHDDPYTVTPDIDWTEKDLACINEAWDD